MKKIFNINSTKKIAIINTFVLTIVALILYPAIPKLLNYPEYSIDNDFQISVVGIKYSHQFLILFVALATFFFFILKFVFNKMDLKHKNITSTSSNSEILKLREQCINFPYIMFLVELIVPTFIVSLLLVLFNTDSELNIRLTIVTFSFVALYAIITYMLNKPFFINTLIETDQFAKNKNEGLRINLYSKLLIQIMPLFIYSIVLILLISLSFMTSEKGALINNYYKQELDANFSTNNVYTIEELKILLEKLDTNSENDTPFIFSAETNEVFYSSVPLNTFLINYTKDFYNITNGQTYEYYGKDIAGTVKKLHTDKGDCFVGFRYYVFQNTFILPFAIVAIVLMSFNCVFIFYIGKSFSKDIKSVVNGMDNILQSDDINNFKNLPVTSNDEISDLIHSFNEIQILSNNNIEKIQSNQSQLVEQERLASLGQMIGGIAHNLKTPIMSISGAAEGLKDLADELDNSIGNPVVTDDDYHDIAKDMRSWISKIKSYSEYMSDVITAVKGQAVNFANDEEISFTISELLKRVDILMKHELKNAIIYLNISVQTDENTVIKGDVNSLVQIINNMLSNAIQAYNGKPEQTIDLTVSKEGPNCIISIQDYASGLSEKIRDRLFKEMITTKGKNGTGLGLYMSYSTIKAHFNGDITFESEPGKGTKFNIILPI